MLYLKKIVSGKKKRFESEGYNLDLTYVCPRIIAMAFPAEGLESLYRNDIEEVAKFIENRHHSKYLVFNLSGRGYNYAKFNHRVITFDWQDHHSPPIHMLFHICSQIHSFLMEDKERVIVAHCLAGKGRTGTIICCYLLFSGRFKSVKQVLDYYGKQRFHQEGLGVNQPCQIRYLQYFYRLLTGEQLSPSMKYIQSICFDGKPTVIFRPFVQLIKVKTKEKFYDTKTQDTAKYQSASHQIKFQSVVPFYGDILIKFIDIGMLKEQTFMRVSLNTAFLPREKQSYFWLIQLKRASIVLVKQDIDPSQFESDERFPEDFNIQIELDNVCNTCDNSTSFDKKCNTCMENLFEEKKSWDIIYKVLQEYKCPTMEESKILLFGQEDDDVEQVLSQNIK